MRSRHKRGRISIGHETSHITEYALSGVAQELARLLKRHIDRRQRTLTRRGETGISKRDVFRLLCRAFSRALFNPRGSRAMGAARQRSALMFSLAAADLPAGLRVRGIPTELHRQRKRRRR